MAKRKKASPKSIRKKSQKPAQKAIGWKAKKLAGLTFCFAGKEKKWETTRAEMEQMGTDEGGKIVKKLNDQVDYLVVMDSGATAGPRKEAAKLIKDGVALAVISESQFTDLFIPTDDEVHQMLVAGKPGHQRLNFLRRCSGSNSYNKKITFDLSGRNLKGCQFVEEKHYREFNFDFADLRESKVPSAHFPKVTGANFEKSKGDFFHFSDFVNCNCKKVSWPNLFMDGDKSTTGTDFSGSDLSYSYFNYGTIKSCKFKNSKMVEAAFQTTKLSDVSFEKCDLRESSFKDSVCKGQISFAGAKLIDSDFTRADLRGSNCRNADFTGARLTSVKFDKADLAGANFKNAILINADFGKADLSKAKNLELPPVNRFKVPPECKQIQDGPGDGEIRIEFDVKMPGGDISISICNRDQGAYYNQIGPAVRYQYRIGKSRFQERIGCSSMVAAFKKAGELFGHHDFQLASVKCSTSKSKLKGKALNELALAALSGIFAAEAPDETKVKAARAKAKSASAKLKMELLAELRGGKKGIADFNQRDHLTLKRKKANRFRKEDFSGGKLDGLKIENVDFQSCNFQEASLKKCEFRDGDFSKADLSRSDFSNTKFSITKLKNCNFEKSKLARVKFEYSSLDNSSFVAADLTGAYFNSSEIYGADFTGAKLSKTKWRECLFDEKTVFPKGFKIPKDFHFGGKGHDPREGKAAPKTGTVNSFDQFMEYIAAHVDQGRLKKAMTMLKKDSFELFSQVNKDELVGVVKSQTDKSLVYSCRLTKEGEFTCCTQNLNACGGLRGSLCKHLLVMLVGLTQGKKLKPAVGAKWCSESASQKPTLEKEIMTEVLLKYQGAEAGDIDWRPMETVPEDYLAF